MTVEAGSSVIEHLAVVKPEYYKPVMLLLAREARRQPANDSRCSSVYKLMMESFDGQDQ